jgi:hypothetical protein
VQMTNRYVHPIGTHKAEAAKKLEEYNAQLFAQMLEKRPKATTISTTVKSRSSQRRKVS